MLLAELLRGCQRGIYIAVGTKKESADSIEP